MRNSAKCDKLLSKLKEAFSKFDEVAAAYLYGSRARGDADERSDWDFAILLRRTFGDPYGLVKLQELLENIVGGRVDLVTLNSASVEFAYRVLKEAILVYEADREFRVDFEVLVMKKYLDLRPLLENRRRRLLGEASWPG
ncbi:MAG: nucleotidyltransferase domain-containing protein [Thermoproteales archaeon]|nr:nucleotidyltransferase domain-containing protein [Thermoproteales archaeon]